jgi:integrase/recombinase XerD
MLTITPASPKTRRAGQNRRRQQLSNAEYHLTKAQLQRVIDAADSSRNRALLQTMAETGLRRAEVAALRVEDLRLADGVLVVHSGKGNKTRIVPLTATLAMNLRALIASRADGAVFTPPAGGHLSLRQVNRIMAKAGRHSGVSNPNPRQHDITCHLFRHSFARLWKAHGGSIESLAKILGHASVKTTWDLYGTEGLADVKRNYNKTMSKISGRGRLDSGQT